MPPARRRPLGRALVAVIVGIGGACASGDAAAPDDSALTDVYGDVGQVPAAAPVATATGDTAPPATDPPTTSTSVEATSTTAPVPSSGDVGEVVDGSRVLVIGDSLMASTAARHGGAMCATLGRLGWTVEVDAESGRFADFGQDVLDERLGEEWDVAAVMLGNNYRDDPEQFAVQVSSIVERLAPRPVVLFTVTEFEDSRQQVNDIIRYIAAPHDNVLVVDWAAETAGAADYLDGDGLHLNDEGRLRLATVLGEALGPAPATPPGTCLESVFDDDSAATIPGLGS